VCIF
jgi:hypothetical protein